MKKLRLFAILTSAPLVLVVVLGGLRGSASAVQGSFAHLRVFEDVISLIMSSYVEEVNVDEVMEGALRGLADELDGDSAYLTPAEVAFIENGARYEPGDVGLSIVRQYYLRGIGVRDGSPAYEAGIRPGDYIRGIDGQPTREMSIVDGMRRLRGAPGSRVTLTVIRGSTVDPRDFELTREVAPAERVQVKTLPQGPAYLRVLSFEGDAPVAIKRAAERLQRQGARMLIIDLRNLADGTAAAGIETARWFVSSGPLATRAARGDTRESIDAKAGDAIITVPVILIVNNGTARAAEVFAAALDGADRAELVGEQTAGSASEQRLVKLPQQRGLWLTWAQYLTRAGEPIHGTGLTPDVVVDEPSVEFDEVPPATDALLDKAIERALAQNAA